MIHRDDHVGNFSRKQIPRPYEKFKFFEFSAQILPKMTIFDTVGQRRCSQEKMDAVYGGTFNFIIIAWHLGLFKSTPSPKSEFFWGEGEGYLLKRRYCTMQHASILLRKFIFCEQLNCHPEGIALVPCDHPSRL